MFCGLPMGVIIEPRFAATVCATSVMIVERGSEPWKSNRVRGANEMRATSFVTIMAVKKESVTSRSERRRCVPSVLVRRDRTRASRPARVKPATTVMRQKRRPMVRQSIASAYADQFRGVGGNRQAERSAARAATTSTASAWMKERIRSMRGSCMLVLRFGRQVKMTEMNAANGVL